MKKGLIRIITGSVLLVLQLISFLNSSVSRYLTGDFLEILAFLLGYFSFGICGILLLISGIITLKSGKTSNVILHLHTKGNINIKNISIVFLAIAFISYIPIIISASALSFIGNISYILSIMFLFVYLVAFYSKKPSMLFISSIIFQGVGFICLAFPKLLTRGILSPDIINIYMLNPLLLILGGILYLIIGIMLYREKFSAAAVKVLSWISFAVLLVGLMSEVCFGFELILDFINNFPFIIVSAVTLIFTGIIVPSCIECNKNIVASDKTAYCRNCGAKLTSESVYCHECGKKIEENEKNCV